ncbi:hypothetical protein CPB86DRAFT_781702 [Serendipita vermifera]|nr:hypothetical protein CPB86DRAFT_781702 [Serendipita vermifera]
MVLGMQHSHKNRPIDRASINLVMFGDYKIGRSYSTKYTLPLSSSPVPPKDQPRPNPEQSQEHHRRSIIHDERRLEHIMIEISVNFYRYYGNATYGQTLAAKDSSLRTADMIAICYDISEPETLHNAIYKWYPMVLYFAPNAPIFLFGCKSKRKKPPLVSKSEAVAACRQIGAVRLLRCSPTDESFLNAVGREMVWYGYYHNLSQRLQLWKRFRRRVHAGWKFMKRTV